MLRRKHELGPGEFSGGRIEVGGWKCKDSIIGECYYDKQADGEEGRWRECCMICGQPSERL